MWGFPWLTRLAIAGMLGIVAAMAFIAEQQAPLGFGVISVGVLGVAYAVRRRLGPRIAEGTRASGQ